MGGSECGKRYLDVTRDWDTWLGLAGGFTSVGVWPGRQAGSTHIHPFIVTWGLFTSGPTPCVFSDTMISQR